MVREKTEECDSLYFSFWMMCYETQQHFSLTTNMCLYNLVTFTMFFDFTADSKNMGDIGFSSTTMSSFDFNKFDEEVKYDQKQIQKLKFKLTLVLDSI